MGGPSGRLFLSENSVSVRRLRGFVPAYPAAWRRSPRPLPVLRGMRVRGRGCRSGLWAASEVEAAQPRRDVKPGSPHLGPGRAQAACALPGDGAGVREHLSSRDLRARRSAAFQSTASVWLWGRARLGRQKSAPRHRDEEGRGGPADSCLVPGLRRLSLTP